MYTLSQFFVIVVEVASNFHVDKSNKHFLVFTTLSPSAASLNTDNLSRFLKSVLLWASSDHSVLVLLLLLFFHLTGYSFPGLLAVSLSSYWHQMFEWASPLYIQTCSLGISSSLMTLNIIYMQMTWISVFSPRLSPDIQTQVNIF